jgi:multicomponent Na+:H+ antiporter subunit G
MTLLAAFCLLAGAAFVLIAAVGVLRMPDLYLRMQASTKGATLGVSAMALAVGLHFGDLETAITAVLVIGFFFLTAPVAAHVIGRAAYRVGVPLWRETRHDDLADHLADADR